MKQTIILNQNRDFQTLYKRGISFVTPFVVIYMRPNRFGVHRLGITAGKRVGNAVQRNRAKRLIRQAYRELEAELPPYLDKTIRQPLGNCLLPQWPSQFFGLFF